MNAELSEKIARLPRLNKAQLLPIWAENFKSPPPPKLRKELMVPILATGCRNVSTVPCPTHPTAGLGKLRFRPSLLEVIFEADKPAMLTINGLSECMGLDWNTQKQTLVRLFQFAM